MASDVPVDQCDLSAYIIATAAEMLEPLSADELKTWSYEDLLMVAMKDWAVVDMVDLTQQAANPFAWFIFRHRFEPWWCSFQALTSGLARPYEGACARTGLLRRGRLTVGANQDEFVENLFALTGTGRADGAAVEAFSRPGRGAGLGVEVGALQVLDDAHARWALGRFPDNERAQACVLLTGLGPRAGVDPGRA